MAHIDAGKTTTTERILFYTKVSYRMGEVHDGTAVMDWMDAGTGKRDHHHLRCYDMHLAKSSKSISLTRRVMWISPSRWKGPLRILDGAVALFCAVGGVEPQSETVWRQGRSIPGSKNRLCLTRLDRVGSDFGRVLSGIRERLGANPVPVQIPIGKEENFRGAIDLVRMKAITFDKESLGADYAVGDIPPEFMAADSGGKRKTRRNPRRLRRGN